MCFCFTSIENCHFSSEKTVRHPKRVVDFPRERDVHHFLYVLHFSSFSFSLFSFVLFLFFLNFFLFLIFFCFSSFPFFHLLSLSLFSVVPADGKNRREVLIVKITIFCCEILIFGPRWTGARG